MRKTLTALVILAMMMAVVLLTHGQEEAGLSPMLPGEEIGPDMPPADEGAVTEEDILLREEELKEELRELQQELQELREELKELATDTD